MPCSESRSASTDWDYEAYAAISYDGQRHIMTPIKVKGIPDLLIEILSPSNQDHDLKTKRRVYERCGVPEYWIVSPEEHRVLQLILSNEQYTQQEALESITMTVVSRITVDLTKVW